MKKYQTWEVIKMLEENPKLQFQYDTGCEYGVIGKVGKDICILECDGMKKELKKTLPLHGGYLAQEWTLVQQPVTFIEAVKAYAEGKTIRCEGAYRKARYIPNGVYVYGTTMNTDLKDMERCPLTLGEILDGTWYIEEGYNE